MRDILLSIIIVAVILRAFRAPETGAYLWAWVSIFNPHTLTYGFSRLIPWAATAAGMMFVALLFPRVRKALPINAITVPYLVLMVWMAVTSVFTINPTDYVLERWIFVFKIHLMMFITFMTLRGRKQILTLVWVVVASVGFYGVKGGVWTLLTGGGGRVWGPPGGMIAGNNELAVALVMLTPILYFLWQTVANRWLRWAVGFSILFIAFGILGTQSRGALLALLAMGFMLGLKGKYPVRTSLGILLLMGVATAFMPDTWTSRMDTIQGYQADSSAMSRIYTWKTLWALAQERPILGAGFGTDNLGIFNRFAPTDPEFASFRGQVWVAHSIYLQALGEHGFPGLILFLLIGVMTWFVAGRLAKSTRDDPEFSDWVPQLARMVQVSLVGYAFGGAFLSLMHLDVIYYIVGFVVLADATVRETRKARQLSPHPVPAANQPLQTSRTHP